MDYRVIALTVSLALGACGKPAVDERNASVADVSKAVSKAQGGGMKFTPGRWESSFSITRMDAPGMPPEASQAMNGMIGKKRDYATCLTKEKADKPGSDFFAKDARNCTYDHFTMGGGKIDAKMHCGAGDAAAVMTMNGSNSPTHYQLDMETQTRTGGAGPMTMRMAVEANHTGACKGNEDGRG